jgi:predicted ATPase
MTAGLLERDAELRRLRETLRGAGQGRGSVVLVSGEAGIGKTSLVGAFTREASGTARVLVGACDDLVTPRTLGPFRDMARGAGGPWPRPSTRSPGGTRCSAPSTRSWPAGRR